MTSTYTFILIRYRFSLLLTLIGALLFCNAGNSQDITLNEVMSSNSTVLTPISEDSFDWVELYNGSENVVNLDGFSLSDQIDNPAMWAFPSDTELLPDSYLVIWLSGNAELTSEGELHSNFKISSQGESVYLFNSSSVLADNSPDLEIQPNYTIGRISGDAQWYYLDAPSPSSENLPENAFPEQATLPEPSILSGVYEDPISLSFAVANTEDIIRYTSDFSEPTESSPVFPEDLMLSENTFIKIKTFRENALQSKTLTLSYIFPEDTSLDIISLTAEPESLFGSDGIYDQHLSGEEKKANLELFENGVMVLNQNVGIKIHSPDSRDQLGFRIYARSSYGNDRLNYPIFNEKDLTSFKTLILRNGGNDGAELEETHFRDAIGHELYLEQNSTNGMAAYKPVNLYLNGDYWGIYNLRERQDEHYLKDNYGVEPDQVDFLEYDYHEAGHMKTISGDWDNWDEMKTFVLDNDLSLPENYEVIQDWVDIDNFTDYQIFEIVIGNQDWCNNNTKFWRPVNGGKWKWVLWDVEYGFGTYGNAPVGTPEFDFFTMAITWGGWQDGDYTWLFRKLLDNTDFRRDFITRLQDLLNTSFLSTHLAEKIAENKEKIENAMPYQLDKWEGEIENWEASIEEFLSYTELRAPYVLTNVSGWYEFEPETYQIEIDLSDPVAGSVELNTLLLDDETIGAQENTFPWTGTYYGIQQLNLLALENPGYEFSHWEGDMFSEEPSLTLYISENVQITAVYNFIGVDPIPDYSDLVINELMSNNQSVFQDEFGEYEDWIEIYNSGNETVDLSGLYLSDDSNNLLKFQIPDSPTEMTLSPNDHIMFYADNNTVQGNLHTNFQLNSSGEEVLLSYINLQLEPTVIDQKAFSGIPVDHSYGRISDGADDWMIFEIPTPDAENEILVGIQPESFEALQVLVYPNPSSNIISFSLKDYAPLSLSMIKFYTLEGKECLTVENPTDLTQLDISFLKSGIYFIELTNDTRDSMARVKFVKR